MDHDRMAEAGECWRQYKATRAETAGAIFSMGQWLVKAKAATAHGDWLPALERQGIPERWAQRAMTLVNRGVKSDTVSYLGIRTCLEMLAGSGRWSDYDPMSGECVNKVAADCRWLCPDRHDEPDPDRMRELLLWLDAAMLTLHKREHWPELLAEDRGREVVSWVGQRGGLWPDGGCRHARRLATFLAEFRECKEVAQ